MFLNIKKKYEKNISYYMIYTFTSRLIFCRAIFILYLIEKSISQEKIGILQATLFLANSFIELPAGLFGDRFGRKYSILIGKFLLFINAVGMILATSFWPFFILFFIHGVAFAFISGSDEALIYDTFLALKKEKDFIKYRGKINLITAISLGIAMLIGGLFVDYLHSWKIVYASTAIAVLLSIFIVSRFIEPPHIKTNKEEKNLEENRNNENIWQTFKRFFSSLQGLVVLLYMISFAILHSFITPYYVYGQTLFHSLGLQASKIAIIYIMVEISGGFFSLLSAKANERFKFLPLMSFFLILMFFIMIANYWASLYFAIALFFITMVLIEILDVASSAYLNEKISSNIRASALSLVSLITSLLTALVYYIYGKLLEKYSPSMVISFLAIIPIISLIFLYFHIIMKRKIKE